MASDGLATSSTIVARGRKGKKGKIARERARAVRGRELRSGARLGQDRENVKRGLRQSAVKSKSYSADPRRGLDDSVSAEAAVGSGSHCCCCCCAHQGEATDRESLS